MATYKLYIDRKEDEQKIIIKKLKAYKLYTFKKLKDKEYNDKVKVQNHLNRILLMAVKESLIKNVKELVIELGADVNYMQVIKDEWGKDQIFEISFIPKID